MKLFKSIRVIVLAICVLVSLLLITNIIPVNENKGIGFGNGLDYGLDFAGGVRMQLKLEKELDSDAMEIEKGILEQRLNAMELRDIPVRSWGDEYIFIEVAAASPQDIEDIKNILKQQANFEQRIDGELVIKGDEISIDLGPTGGGVLESNGGYSWSVTVKLNKEGACRFGEVAHGKFFGADNPRNSLVDIFIDRPENTTVLMAESTYNILINLTSAAGKDSILYDDSGIRVIENRSAIPVIVLRDNVNETLSELESYRLKGYIKTILAGDEEHIPDNIRNLLEERGIETQRNPQGDRSSEEWIKDMTGLKTAPRLNFDTRGECIYTAQITGWANTLDEARDEIKENRIWLTSGNLPAKASIESESQIPQTQAEGFLKYSFFIAIFAIFIVALVVFLRYRKPFIVGPMLITGLSEILIILGFASLINWELDLPAVAGIIAAVGTGVDHQIVITDETIKPSEKKKVVSLNERIRRAFFVIFTAAATTVAVMIPLYTIQGVKGFAFTTIIGVLIGVFITRPAYAKIIEELFKR